MQSTVPSHSKSNQYPKMPEISNRPKHTRKRGANVKAGCITCKIRRKKCDETRPACLQCTSTSRACDFLQPLRNQMIRPWNGNPTGLSRQSRPLLTILPEEVVHFDYFRTQCTEEFSASFVTSLWKELIMQATHAESFVLNAVLAIGALRRFQLESEGFAAARNVPLSLVKYSIEKYSKATRELRDRLGARTADWKLSVLGSIVFLAIEVLQGNETEAIAHFRGGSAILNTVSCSDYDMPSNWNIPKPSALSNLHPRVDDFDVLASAFTHLDVEELSFAGSNIVTVAAIPDPPKRFNSIAEARSSLNTIIACVYAFLRRSDGEHLKTLPFHPLPEAIYIELAQTQNVLQSWHQTFSIFLSARKKADDKENLSAKVLLIQHLVARIKISAHFFYDQMIYDSYLEHFAHIVDMTSAIVKSDNLSWTQSRGPCFTLDIAMVKPLYFVVLRCRNPALRRRAVDIMSKVGRDGIYTGKSFARVAEWVVDKEEMDGLLDGAVRKGSRFHHVVLEFGQVERTVTVSATRKSPDGALVRLVENLDLPV